MEDPIIQEESKRFKAFRLAENLTQTEIGEFLNRSKSQINKFEDGTRRITIQDVKLLHLKLGMSYEWFYHGKGHRKFKPQESTLLKDVSALRTMIDITGSKIDQIDQVVKKLVRDFYSKNV